MLTIQSICEFFRSSIGKAATGLLATVIAICFPWIPGYAFAAFALYYTIHQARPVTEEVLNDLKHDLRTTHEDEPAGQPENP